MIFHLGSRRDRQTRLDRPEEYTPEVKTKVAANIAEIRKMWETPNAKRRKRPEERQSQNEEKEG